MKTIVSGILFVLLLVSVFTGAFNIQPVKANEVVRTSPLTATPVHNINTGLNYTTIQSAIDDPETLDGHTLICDAGNYTENVHVHKSLNITAAIWSARANLTYTVLPTYNLTITATVGGTTNPAPGTYCYTANSTVQVTAIPDANYLFDHWELDGSNVSSANPYTVTMNQDHVLIAVFVVSIPVGGLSMFGITGGPCHAYLV